ncbi:MAG: Thiazole synthase [Chroococcopsis gigantea SAG 12.99]|jgi:thiazole synthase|nr:glycine oxidase ThiO [Chlorogloea purpurea SAG 13.99]MDV3001524.1 Thiazole synthase [Chroococcopsis gigantea SAG 12.99]
MKSSSEILIIGCGVIGLSIALDLTLRGAKVRVFGRNPQGAASMAAAGMLAPHAEGIQAGPMLDLCLKSRWLYPEWVRKIEDLTGLRVGYHPCGILAPVYEDNADSKSDQGQWLDRDCLGFYQSGLGPDVVGARWYPDDGQVDNRLLVRALSQALINLGVIINTDVQVHSVQQKAGQVKSIYTSSGEEEADIYVLAGGAWSSQLLPLPVKPVKGQMMALRMPQPSPLQRILFAPGTYLVPRQEGRLIIGATSESVGWQEGNTPLGIQTLLGRAMKLYPDLASWPIEEIWWGFRPGTADELPILGAGGCDNLVLAVGHYRNGILLAPVTGSLIADLILENKVHPLLQHFQSDRFQHHSPRPKKTMTLTLPDSTTQLTPIDKTKGEEPDFLTIAGRRFKSRLMTGSGKYSSIEAMQLSVAASECEIVTVAVRRVQTKAPGHEGLAQALDWSKIWMLPNTAGCQTAEEAIRVARLGREMAKLLGQEDNNFVKLEVIPDAKYLLPDPIGTLQAAEQLVKEGFAVLPYINADPLLAKRLEEIGCATVMPLGSPIGSGQGIKNAANIAIIIESAKIPVVVDAGIGTPSEASGAMEMGADALLINSAIALAQNPVMMAQAMGMAAKAGRLAYRAGRMPLKSYASASSPLTGTIE